MVSSEKIGGIRNAPVFSTIITVPSDIQLKETWFTGSVYNNVGRGREV
jgi:hypothetical protein